MRWNHGAHASFVLPSAHITLPPCTLQRPKQRLDKTGPFGSIDDLLIGPPRWEGAVLRPCIQSQ